MTRSSAIGLKISVKTTGIKKYKSIIKKKRKKHDKILLLSKSKLNSKEFFISKDLINSNISHEEIVLINDVLKEFYDVNEGIQNSNDKYKFKLYVETVPFYWLKCRKNTKIKTQKFERLETEE